MSYVPEFSITERNNLAALWVKMPNGQDYNIWDFPPNKVDPELLSAIKCAFYRGVEAQKQVVDKANITRVWDRNEWNDKR